MHRTKGQADGLTDICKKCRSADLAALSRQRRGTIPYGDIPVVPPATFEVTARPTEPFDSGCLSELIAVTYYISNGCVVSMPYGARARYDFVVDDGTKLRRVQVKTLARAAGQLGIPFNAPAIAYTLGVRVHADDTSPKPRSPRDYGVHEVDYIVGVESVSRALYEFPTTYMVGKRRLVVYPFGRRINAKQDNEQYRVQ